MPSMVRAPHMRFPGTGKLRLSGPKLRRFRRQNTALRIVVWRAHSTAPRSFGFRPDTQPEHTPLRAARGTTERPAKAQLPFAVRRWRAHASPSAGNQSQAGNARVQSSDPTQAFSAHAQSADRNGGRNNRRILSRVDDAGMRIQPDGPFVLGVALLVASH